MNKATHAGSCQICGRAQKLPGDRLSTHGYTTRWGFFAGICPGSGHLPFEISCDLIATAAANARKDAQACETKAATVGDAKEAKRLTRQARQLIEYAQWQEARKANWFPGTVRALPDAATEVQARAARAGSRKAKQDANAALSRAKREYEQALDTLARVLLLTPPTGRDEAWNELYYARPTAAHAARLEKLRQALAPAIAEQVAPLVAKAQEKAAGVLAAKAALDALDALEA